MEEPPPNSLGEIDLRLVKRYVHKWTKRVFTKGGIREKMMEEIKNNPSIFQKKLGMWCGGGEKDQIVMPRRVNLILKRIIMARYSMN